MSLYLDREYTWGTTTKGVTAQAARLAAQSYITRRKHWLQRRAWEEQQQQLTQSLTSPSQDAVITFDYEKSFEQSYDDEDQTKTYRIMRKPFMRNNHLRMSLQPRLYPPRLPIPENNIPLSITATNPFSIRGKSYLTCVSCDGMTGETLFTILTEVVGAVD